MSVAFQNAIRIMAPRVSPNPSNVLSSGEDRKGFFHFHSFSWTENSSPGACCLILLLSEGFFFLAIKIAVNEHYSCF